MSRVSGLAWQATPGGYVAVLCDGAPRSVVFDALIQWARARAEPIAGLVIQDLRGGLDAARSDCLRRLGEGLDAPVAILTGSHLLRGAAAVRWLGERVCAFGPRDDERAFEQLQVPAPRREALRAALRALRVARQIRCNRSRRSPGFESSAA